MKILLYGSTFISALVEKELMKSHEVVHIPSEKPTFPGKMSSPLAPLDYEYDLALSVQYDKKIENLTDAYNLHTGLLPGYGGCDILYHTIANKEKKQGLTLHKLTEKFDQGEIISSITYAVGENDKAVDLYKKMSTIAPLFVINCLALLSISKEGIRSQVPSLYKRGIYPHGDVLKTNIYLQDYEEINAYVSS